MHIWINIPLLYVFVLFLRRWMWYCVTTKQYNDHRVKPRKRSWYVFSRHGSAGSELPKHVPGSFSGSRYRKRYMIVGKKNLHRKFCNNYGLTTGPLYSVLWKKVYMWPVLTKWDVQHLRWFWDNDQRLKWPSWWTVLRLWHYRRVWSFIYVLEQFCDQIRPLVAVTAKLRDVAQLTIGIIPSRLRNIQSSYKVRFWKTAIFPSFLCDTTEEFDNLSMCLSSFVIKFGL